MMKMTTLGLIGTNRNFFPGHLCESGIPIVKKVLQTLGFEVISLTPDETKYGSIESLEESKKCAALFDENRQKIDGIVVTLPNFGDERSVANAIRWSNLDVPVLVHAFNDEIDKMDNQHRRDSFCGKISLCNALHQYGIKYSLTTSHVIDPNHEEFKKDLRNFSATCRVVKGMRSVRVGMIGSRPSAFNTVRFSEKILETNGISVEPIDLFELISRAEKLTLKTPGVQEQIQKISDYLPVQNIRPTSVEKLARFMVVINQWMEEYQLDANAIQCWSAIEEYYGVAPCLMMSMMSNTMVPSACETDITGALSMYALQLASGTPSAIVDWNNNYGDEPNKCVVFHCSNLPACMFVNDQKCHPSVEKHGILKNLLGPEKTEGVIEGRITNSPMTYCKLSTDDLTGRIRVYTGEGVFTDDPLNTFGACGVLKIPDLDGLLRYICTNGFEHHVAISLSSVSDILFTAFGEYLGFEIHKHQEQRR